MKIDGRTRENWRCPHCGGYDAGGVILSCSGCGREAEPAPAEVVLGPRTEERVQRATAPVPALPANFMDNVIQQVQDEEAELARLRNFYNEVSAALAAEGPQTVEHLLATARLGKETTVIGRSRLAQLQKAEAEVERLKAVPVPLAPLAGEGDKPKSAWTCRDCGNDLIFSCRELGTGFCHRCAHKRYAATDLWRTAKARPAEPDETIKEN